jgi:S1-C subfamily serine protease
MVPIHNSETGAVIASGVLINERMVLTAAHVSTGDARVNCGGVDITSHAVAYDRTVDLSLLTLEFPCPLTISKIAHKNAALGSEIHGSGCPKAKCGWLIFGRVIAYDTLPAAGDARPVMVSDAPIWMGHSGGPMYDVDGKLVGVASQMMRYDGPNGAFRLYAIYVPVESIWAFLSAISSVLAPESIQ